MGLRLSHTTFDAVDPYAIAEFWRTLLGWIIMADPDGNEFCILSGS